LAIGNRKVPRQAARDFNSLKFVSGSECRVPELFSWLFYVAASRLNSPRFSSVLIRNLKIRVKRFDDELVFGFSCQDDIASSDQPI
jgi:hypothetical protein